MFDLQKQKQPTEDAIIVSNVSKHFRIPHEKKTKLFEHIAGALKGNTSTFEEFWAVKEVSFTVKKGETLGIIGENGSGKSTLLKLIAGVLTPDSGTVKVAARSRHSSNSASASTLNSLQKTTSGSTARSWAWALILKTRLKL